MIYLRSSIEMFIRKTNKTNIFMPSWSMKTSWGSSSLMNMFLKALKDLNDFKMNGKWMWDFVINLSESDFPLK